MITNKLSLIPTFSWSTGSLLIVLLNLLSVAPVLADASLTDNGLTDNGLADNGLADNGYRKEPIFPIPQEIEVNEAKVALGELLFFDTRLSRNNQLSCASCHQLDAGGDDNVALGTSLSAEQHVMNTPTVFNAVFNFRQNWNGSVKTLEQQVEMVINSHHEFNTNWEDVMLKLSNDIDLSNDFHAVYMGGMNKDNVVNAIVEFNKSLITPNSRFDRYLRNEKNSLTAEEIKGYKIFKEQGCISCHQGINVGGNLYQKFGVFYNYLAERGNINKLDYGRINITGRQMDIFVFKVPSLRNVLVTGPYLHDGSAETIEDAISIMGRTQLGKTLTKKEIYYIKAFLNTLTGEYKNKLLGTES